MGRGWFYGVKHPASNRGDNVYGSRNARRGGGVPRQLADGLLGVANRDGNKIRVRVGGIIKHRIVKAVIPDNPAFRLPKPVLQRGG